MAKDPSVDNSSVDNSSVDNSSVDNSSVDNSSVDERSVSVSRLIDAPAADIFAVLTNPARHAEIDGSGTVRGSKEEAPEPLTMGSKFGMKMKMGVPYDMRSTVVEYEENELIAWAHFGKHRWRYELEQVEGGTMVTETFDWSASRAPKLIEIMGYPKKHVPSMQKTLERLEAVATTPTE